MDAPESTRSGHPDASESSGAAPEAARARRYLLPLLAGPALMILASLIIVPSRWLEMRSGDAYAMNMGYGVRLHGRNCQLLIYGDSGAMVGVNPDILEQRTGLTACNIAEYEGVTMVSQTLPLDIFLRNNPPPRYLLFVYAPQNLNLPWGWSANNVSEAITFRLQQKPDLAAFLLLIAHPTQFMAWVEGGLHTALNQLRAKPYPAETTHLREPTNGQFRFVMGSPRTVCDTRDFRVAPEPRWIAHLRTAYARNGTTVLVDALPTPACDPNNGFFAPRLRGLVDNDPVPNLPLNAFTTEGILHTDAYGSGLLSNLIADQILAKEHSRPAPQAAVFGASNANGDPLTLLFSSNAFLFAFLPVTLIGYQLLSRFGRNVLLSWLTLVSLFFYGYWNPKYLILLGVSMLMNFCFSFRVAAPEPSDTRPRSEASRSRWLAIAIVVNIALLMYYKYLFPFLNFFYQHHLSSRRFDEIVLPLGISFFTFTQIAYLIDVRQEIAKRQPLIPYSVFVTFFPHLIAGPIIHPRELMPQYDEGRIGPLKAPDLALGFTWFILGLAKKVLIADRLAPLADVMYAHVHSAGIATSWLGALCYSLQLYFDFSGYSDMALGLARMFSLEFPINFHSPFKSQSVIEFWAHWHMTLTRYLNEYVYTPILRWVNSLRIDAGKKVNRKAAATPEGFVQIVVFPTMTTMFISGIWHGVGLEFIAFGLVHGVFLCINHAWRLFTPGTRLHRAVPAPIMVVITYACVLVGHVFFRANTVSDACYVLGSMIGLHHGPSFADYPFLHEMSHAAGFLTHARTATLAVAVCYFICLALPNTQEILNRLPEGYVRLPSLLPRFSWRMSAAWSFAMMFLLCASMLLLDSASRFLYFQF